MNKTFKRLAVFATAAVMTASAFAFAACTPDDGNKDKDPNPVVQEKKVTKIAVTTRPRLKYIVGETFDKTGMVVTVTYDDGSTEEVTDYTVDKTAPLTLRDSSVTVMYKGKMAFLPLKVGIELKDGLSIDTAENAVYTVEAEDMDFTYCTNSNVAGTPPNVEISENASNNKSIGSLAVVGNMFGFKITCSEEMQVQIVMRASAVVENIDVDGAMSMFVNDEIVESGQTLTWGGDGAWWNWEHAYYNTVTFKEGTNEFYMKVLTGRVPNIDCFYFVVSPTGEEVLGPGSVTVPPAHYESFLDITSAEAADYTIEAESLDFSKCVNSGNTSAPPSFEAPPADRNTSGGVSVGGLSVYGNRFGFAVTSTVKAKIKITMRVATGIRDPQNLDECWKLTWNNKEVKTGFTVSSIPHDNDGNEMWNVWESAVLNNLDLEIGENTFDLMVLTTSPNIDCFIISVIDENAPAPEHECAHVCETCGKCMDSACEDAACADKCTGHEPAPDEHECAHVCETCGKCTDNSCEDAVCADKCTGHEPVTVAEWEQKVEVTSADNARYTVEAEGLDLSQCTHTSGSGRPNFEDPATVTSGGKCVSSLGYNGNKLGFTVKSGVEGTANLILRVSSGASNAQDIDKLVLLTWNGIRYKTGYIAPNPTDASVGWHNWQSAIMYNLPLTVGYNNFTLKVVGGGCPNIDCFILEVSPDNTGIEIPEFLQYDKMLDITSGDNAEYKVEAEALDYIACVNSNNQAIIPNVENPSTETSGGQSIGSLGVAGNKFGFTVASTVSGKIKISFRVSSGNANAQVLDDIMKITWNGVEYKTGYTVSAVENGVWHVWETAEISVELDLLAENNVLVIEILQNSAPNFDCFIIEVNPVNENAPEHTCEHVCETCGKCTDITCEDPACENKCQCEAEGGEQQPAE